MNCSDLDLNPDLSRESRIEEQFFREVDEMDWAALLGALFTLAQPQQFAHLVEESDLKQIQ